MFCVCDCTGMTHGVLLALCIVALSVAALYGECMTGNRHGVFSVVRHYLSVRCVSRTGRQQREVLERDTLSIRRVQEETLLKRLRDMAHTNYGLEYHFGSITGLTYTYTAVMSIRVM